MRDAALALVRDSAGRVLCVSRLEPPYEMALPGGEVEDGEMRAAAAARELEEETGVVAVASRLVWLDRSPTDGRLVYVYRVVAVGEPSAREARTSVGWLSPSELIAQGVKFGGFSRRMFESVRV